MWYLKLIRTLIKKNLRILPEQVSLFHYSFLFFFTVFSAFAHPWNATDLMILLLNYMVSLGKFILSHSSNHHLFTEDSQSQITRSKTLLDSKPACTSIYISKWMLQAHMSKMEAIFFSSKPPSSQSLASLTLIRNFKSF